MSKFELIYLQDELWREWILDILTEELIHNPILSLGDLDNRVHRLNNLILELILTTLPQTPPQKAQNIVDGLRVLPSQILTGFQNTDLDGVRNALKQQINLLKEALNLLLPANLQQNTHRQRLNSLVAI